MKKLILILLVLILPTLLLAQNKPIKMPSAPTKTSTTTTTTSTHKKTTTTPKKHTAAPKKHSTVVHHQSVSTEPQDEPVSSSGEKATLLEYPEPNSVTKSVDSKGNWVFTIDGVSFTMVAVEGGTFKMGRTWGWKDELPVHPVTLRSYMIGQTEVTQELWEVVMGYNPSLYSGENHPVERVDYGYCLKFVKRLSEITNLDFSLPTEAEWEYAARGGKLSKEYKFCGSNTVQNVSWYDENSGNTTHEVATKQPNELGLYDMSGNVWEWCLDWYGNYTADAQNNPTGPSTGTERVIRGGDWYNVSDCGRSTMRSSENPFTVAPYYGLRLVVHP